MQTLTRPAQNTTKILSIMLASVRMEPLQHEYTHP